MSWIQRLASSAPAPVFAAIGENGLAAADDLALDAQLSFKASPREAGILLVTGEIDAARRGYLERLHDQLPHPRATVFWQSGSATGFANAAAIGQDEDPAGTVADIWRALLSGERVTEPDILPDEPPNDWRGKGDHGQGGEGMMGGVPYGRPMAMTGDDIRDGLQLDAYIAEFGPFLPALPSGLVLKLTLQGDVIQTLTMEHPPFPQADETSPASRLRRAARLMWLIGQPARAERMQRLAMRIARGEQKPADLAPNIPPSWTLAGIPSGLGEAGETGDVRARLGRMLHPTTATSSNHAHAGPTAEGRLDHLLTGLEWHEAMLVIASFSAGEIARLGANMSAAEDEKSHEAHSAHGSHHGHGGHG